MKSKQKAAVALEAIKGMMTTSQIASEYEVHPTQVGLWKQAVLRHADELFADTRKREGTDQQDLISRLYQTIGQRDIELVTLICLPQRMCTSVWTDEGGVWIIYLLSGCGRIYCNT